VVGWAPLVLVPLSVVERPEDQVLDQVRQGRPTACDDLYRGAMRTERHRDETPCCRDIPLAGDEHIDGVTELAYRLVYVPHWSF
jgi:hypothetical protein